MEKDEKYFEKLYTKALYKYLVNADCTWEQGRKIPLGQSIPEPLNKHFFGDCIYNHLENIKVFKERITDFKGKLEEDSVNNEVYKEAIKTVETLINETLNGNKDVALQYKLGTALPMTAPLLYIEVPLTVLDIPEEHKIENMSVVALLASNIGTLKNNQKYINNNSEQSLYEEFLKGNDEERYKMLLDDVVITRITVFSDEGTGDTQYIRYITSTPRPKNEYNKHVKIIGLNQLTK